MRRSIYLAICLALSAVAGLFYYDHTRLANAVMATHDLTIGTRIQDGDVAVRAINPSSLQGQLLHSADQAIGRIVASPILRDQFVDARQVSPVKNASLLSAGLQLPPGYRIIGLPITPSAAVGGVLKSGDLVDVMAINDPAKDTSLSGQTSGVPRMLGRNVLVIGLRSDQGAPIEPTDTALNSGNKAASVLLAIPEMDESTYSAAIANSTFVLAMSTD